jgi:hypothetical protein
MCASGISSPLCELRRPYSFYAVAVLGSGSVIQGIILDPGDRLFDAGMVVVKQFLSLRAGGVSNSAIGRRHRNLCDHEGAGGSGDIFGNRHRSKLLSFDIFFSNPLAREAGAARVLLSPFWAGAAHIMQLGPVGIE